MSSFAPTPTFRLAADPEAPPFQRILCGINGSRASREAVCEALAFAAGGATLRFVAIADEVGFGPNRTALLSPYRADAALAEARAAARDAGIPAGVVRLDDPQATMRLLEEALDHDLLVIGASLRSRAGAMFAGGTAGTVLHRTGIPVLLARPSSHDTLFPAHVLVATDATTACRDAVRTGARIAQRHGVALTLAHVTEDGPHERHELARQAADAQEITAIEPIVLSETGRCVPRLLELADAHDDTLIVLGSSGRHGLGSLGSVSERVAARASSPVLVLRAGPAS